MYLPAIIWCGSSPGNCYYCVQVIVFERVFLVSLVDLSPQRFLSGIKALANGVCLGMVHAQYPKQHWQLRDKTV